MYDFSLTEEFMAINDNLVVVPLILAITDIVLAVLMIVFTRKARRREEYTIVVVN